MELEFLLIGSAALRNAVDFARKNNIALLAGQKALDEISALEKAAYSAIQDFVEEALNSILDIPKVDFTGMMMADPTKQKAIIELIV